MSKRVLPGEELHLENAQVQLREPAWPGVTPRSWSFLGPEDLGGRTRALLVHPDFESTPVLYAAGSFGGVWKSSDGAESWELLSALPGYLSIQAMVMDPRNPNVVFVGTGDGFSPAGGWRGSGIFVTRDGGESWDSLPATADFGPVNDLAIDESGRLYAATGTGVWRTDGGENSWVSLLDAKEPRGCLDLVLFGSGSELLVSCGLWEQSSVYRLTVDGARQVLSEPGTGRISLAAAPSSPDVVYALAASLDPDPRRRHGLHAVFRSEDGGRTWERRIDASSRDIGALLLSNPIYARLSACADSAEDEFLHQGWHNSLIAVDPEDPNVVWAGGVDLFRSDDGGRSWGLASAWWLDNAEAEADGRYVHADQHRIVFASRARGGEPILFVANDGGIFRTDNPRAAVARGAGAVCSLAGTEVHWRPVNRHYGGVQIQGAGVASDGRRYLIGTQDQGTLLGIARPGEGPAWNRILEGDGGAVAFSPGDPTRIFMVPPGQGVTMLRSEGAGFQQASIGLEDSGGLFIPPLLFDAARRLWTGGRFLWRSDDQAETWRRVGPRLAHGEAGISAVTVSPVDPRRILVALSDGTIYRGSADDARRKAWPSARPREGFVSSLHFDAHDPLVAWATYSTFGGSHVWRTGDGGVTWAPLDGRGEGTLPDTPVHALAIDEQYPMRLVAGTDMGLFTSYDGGLSWLAEGTPFGPAMVESLAFVDGALVVFTQGRGVWRGVESPEAPKAIVTADVRIDMAADLATATPGDTVTYTITVFNDGPEDVTGIGIDDTFPAVLTNEAWDCASCTPVAGTGDLATTADLTAGSNLTITATADVLGGTSPQIFNNLAALTLTDVTDPDPGNNSANADVEVVATDFGDAPAPYPTLAADDGARHGFDVGVGLGSAPDTEADGIPDPAARGDDLDAANDDGDGVFPFLPPGDLVELVACTPATVPVVIALFPPGQAFLNGWVDFLDNGNWTDPDEQVFDDVEFNAFGVNNLTFNVSCDLAPTDLTFARFRISSAGGDGPTGSADDGEVEDRAVAILSRSDLQVTKTLDTPPYPGTEVQYTVTICNNGPSPATATVDDAFPGLTGVEWTCSPSPLAGGAACAANGTGPLVAEPVVLPAELGLPVTHCVSFVAVGDLDAGATGTLSNTATATLTSGDDPSPGDNTDSVAVSMEPTADLAVTKTNGQDIAVLNGDMTYTITVTNNGPSHAFGALVTDAFAELGGAEWGCAADPLASCTAGQPPGTSASGSGALSSYPVDLPQGGQLVFTATGTTLDGGTPGEVSNTVTVSWSGGTDPDPLNNIATDTDPLVDLDYGDAPDCTPQPDCAPPAYATLLENDGARHQIVAGIYLGSIPDAEIDGQPDPADGDDNDGGDDEDGFLNALGLDFIACETTSLSLLTIVDSGLLGTATGFLNAWIDYDADGSFGPGEQIFTDHPLTSGLRFLDFQMPCDAEPGDTYLRLRFSTEAGLTPGGLAPDGEVEDYRIEILGLDYGDAPDCEPKPACGTGYATLLESDGARHIDGSGIFLGSELDPDPIDAEPVALASPNADGDDMDGNDDEEGVTFLPTTLVAGYDTIDLVPGLGQPGPDAVIEVTAPAACDSRLCVLQGWIDFNRDYDWDDAGEQVVFNETLASGTQQIVINAPDFAATVTGITTFARFRVASVGDIGPTGLLDAGEVEDYPVDIIDVANLTITKTTLSDVVPGEPLIYEVTVSNPEDNAAFGVTVADAPSALLSNVAWDCTAAGGATCTASGLGDLLDTVVDLPFGGSVTYTITGDLATNAQDVLGEDPLVNTASATLPEGIVNLTAADLRTVSATVSDLVGPRADLGVSINDGAVSAVPGTAISYSVIVTNAGPSDAPGSQVVNTFPEILEATVTWDCTGFGGAICEASGNGLPNLPVDLPVGGSVTISVEGTLDPAALGYTQNEVTVTPAPGIIDPDPINNSAIDDDTLLTPEAALGLSKVDVLDPAADGSTESFEITVCNDGPSNALNVRVTDALPTGITATATSGCTEDGIGGIGAPLCSLSDVAASACASFFLIGSVSATATELVLNTAVVAADTPLLEPPPDDDPTEETCIYPDQGELPLSMRTGDLASPAVAAGDTRFATVWMSNGGEGPDLQESSIRAQRLAGDGTFLPPVDGGPDPVSFQVNTFEPGSQSEPAIAMAPDGRFVAVWTSEGSPGGDGDGTSIQGQVFAAAGSPLGPQFQVNDFTGGNQQHPAVALADDGSFLVAWDSLGSPGSDAFTLSVQARRFDAAGTPASGQYQVNTLDDGPQEYPAIAFLASDVDGRPAAFTVTWQSVGSLDGDGAGYSVQGRRIELDGTPAGVEVQLNEHTAGNQRFPAVNGNGEGFLVVAWESDSSPTDLGDGGDGIGIQARRFDALLQPLDSEFRVNEQVSGAQTRPSVTLGEDRNLTVAWESLATGDADLRRRSFTPDGTPFDGESTIQTYSTGDQRRPRIAANRSGDFMTVWQGPSSACRGDASVLGRLEIVDKADLEITISGQSGAPAVTSVPGGGDDDILEVSVKNLGPQGVMDARVTVLVPDEMDEMIEVRWFCNSFGSGAVCPGGFNSYETDPLVNVSIDLPVGGEALFTLTFRLDAGIRVEPVVPALVAVGAGVADPNVGNNSDELTVTPLPQADLAITKDDGLTMATPGETPITYTVTASNPVGPSAVFAAPVFDQFSPELINCSWTCTPAGDASCLPDQLPGTPSSNPGPVNELAEMVDLPVGTIVTYEVICDLDPDAVGIGGFLVNTATITPPPAVLEPEPPFPEVVDSNLDNNTATDDDTMISASADLSITKTGPVELVQTGEMVTFTVAVENTGPSVSRAVKVLDALTEELVFESATIPYLEVTPMDGEPTLVFDLGDLPAGETSSFDLVVQVVALPFDIGADGATIYNTASVRSCAASALACVEDDPPPVTIPDPEPGNDEATASISVRPDFLVSDPAAVGEQTLPAIAANAAGSFVVVWDGEGFGMAERDIHAQLYASDGSPQGSDFIVNGGTMGNQVKPEVAMTSTGDFMVVWESEESQGTDREGTSILGRLYDADGRALTGDVQINTFTTLNQINPDIAVTPTDGFVVVWQGRGPAEDTEDGVRGQRLSSTAALVGVELQVNTYTTDEQSRPSVSVDAAGNFVVAWESLGSDSAAPGSGDPIDDAGASIQARRFAAEGTGQDEDFQINADTANDQRKPAIASLPGGEFFAIWERDKGSQGIDLRGRFFCRDGRPAAGEEPINDEDTQVQETPTLAFLGGEDFIYVWKSSEIIDDGGGLGRPPDFLSDPSKELATKDGRRRTRIIIRRPGDGSIDIVVEDEIVIEAPGVAHVNGRFIAVWAQAGEIFARVLDVDPPAQALIDGDSDTVPDGCDRCPGLDDRVDGDGNGVPDCAEVDLEITKGNDVGTISGVTPPPYTITVCNNGPGDVTGALVEDTFSELFDIASVEWSCQAFGSASCVSGGRDGEGAMGTGHIAQEVDIATGGCLQDWVEFTVTSMLDPAAVTGQNEVCNTATVSPPYLMEDPDGSNNESEDCDDLSLVADLGITKSNGADEVAPGATVVYTIVVTNGGPNHVVGAKINDAVPPELSNVQWSCGDPAACDPGVGDIVDLMVDVPAGGSVTITLQGDLDGAARGTLSNTATVTPPDGVEDPGPDPNTATDDDLMVPQVDLAVSKSNDVTEVVAGVTTEWTITVSNQGPVDAIGAELTDIFPAECETVFWCQGASCNPQTSGTPGNIDTGLTLDVPEDGSVVFKAVCLVERNATGRLINTATVSPPTDLIDPDDSDDSATDDDTIIRHADLEITKDDGLTAVTAGGQVVYTIDVKNNGLSDVDGEERVLVEDEFPPQLENCSWCMGSAPCGAGATPGNLSAEINLPYLAEQRFTAECTVESSATGTLVNTATVTPPMGITDPIMGNNVARDEDTEIGRISDVAILIDSDIPDPVTAGTALTYSLTVSNAGPSDADADVAMVLDADLSACSCTSSGGACGPVVEQEPPNQTSIGTFHIPVGGEILIEVACAVASSARGTLSSSASVSVPIDPQSGNNVTLPEDTTVTTSADLGITKDNGVAVVVPGTRVGYDVVVTNHGPSDGLNCQVVDDLPEILTDVTWVLTASSAGASCAFAAGAGDLDQLCDIPAGGSLTFDITAELPASAIGRLRNTATVACDEPDPGPNPNTATDDDPSIPVNGLTITKTDNQGQVAQGDVVSYVIEVFNAGPSDVVGATVTDTFPLELDGVEWSCVADNGASCGQADGIGDIDVLVTINDDRKVTFTATGTVAPRFTGELCNEATVTPSVGLPVSDEDCTNVVQAADIGITKTSNVAQVSQGGEVIYTIEVTNHDPDDATTSCTVSDVFPDGIESPSWDCEPTPGSDTSCVSGSPGQNLSGQNGDIGQDIDLLPGESVTFTVTAMVSLDAAEVILNQATVGGCSLPDLDAENDVDQASVSVGPAADIEVTKTNQQTGVIQGDTVTYEIVVTNLDPDDTTSCRVSDDFPPELPLEDLSWGCVPTAGASCVSETPGADLTGQSGDIDQIVDLSAGKSVTFTVTATLDPDATGRLVNMAAVSECLPDLNPDNNSDTDDDAILQAADVGITKTNGVTEVNAGTPVTYTIVATNQDVYDTTRCTVSDDFPTLPPAALQNLSWDCTPTGNASCDGVPGAGLTGQTGDIGQLVELPPEESVTFTVTATLAQDAIGTLTNMATVSDCSLPDLNPANDSATDDDPIPPAADVEITKTNEVGEVVAGAPVTYTIVATNLDFDDTTTCTVSDLFPPELQALSWGCDPTPGSDTSCVGGSPGQSLSGQTGDISQVVDLLPRESVAFTVTATVDPDATATLSNTATVSGCTTWDPNTANDSATDNDAIRQSADVGITKTNGVGVDQVNAGTTVVYTIEATNLDMFDTTSCTVADDFPAVLQGLSWDCTPTGNASCDGVTPGAGLTGQIGDISQLVELPPGERVIFTATATLDPDATGMLTNTAMIVDCSLPDLNPGNDYATDSDAIPPAADVEITKTNEVGEVVAGAPVTYTIVATNLDAVDTTTCTVSDLFPEELVESLAEPSWDCVSTGDASCDGITPGADLLGQIGDIDQDVDLPPTESVTFTVTATVDPDATGTLSNMATVSGCTTWDPNTANDSATDDDAIRQSADVGITKTNGVGVDQVNAGTPVTYTIVASNLDMDDTTRCTVSDAFPRVPPAALEDLSWDCAPTGGASCDGETQGAGLIGQTDDIDQIVELPPGQSVTFTVAATLAQDATGTLANTATIGDCSLPDLNPANDSATDSDEIPPAADVDIIKINGVNQVVEEQTVIYFIVARNLDLDDATRCTISDDFPPELVASYAEPLWDCVPTGGASCDGISPGVSLLGQVGDIGQTVDLPAGEGVTFTVTATVASGAAGMLENTATVSACTLWDPNTANDSATDKDPILPSADVGITKDNGASTVNAGAPVVYNIVATNHDLDDATRCTVSDAFPRLPPAALEGISWDCAPTGGASCDGVPGAGLTGQTIDIDQVVDLPPGQSVIFTVSATLAQDATGTLANTASVDCLLEDLNPWNNSATDTDEIPPAADVVITKTNGVAEVVAGTPVTYEIVATNQDQDPSDSTSCLVSDVFPPELQGVSWGCVPTPGNGTSCVSGMSGQSLSGQTDDIDETVDLQPGESVTFTVTATIDADAAGTLRNTATVSDCTLWDPNTENNSAKDEDPIVSSADVGIDKTNNETAVIQGDVVSYTIVATNLDPADTTTCTVSDAFPPALPLADLSWGCAPTGGASCESEQPGQSLSGQTGHISQTVDLPAGARVTFTVTATLDPNATGKLANTARVSGCSLPDLNPDNDSMTDEDDILPSADVIITKGDGQTAVVQGAEVTYRIVATNLDLFETTSCTVSDTFPPELLALSWDCEPTSGSATSCISGTAGQSLSGQTTDINHEVDLLAGESVVFTVTATLDPRASGTLINTATIDGCSLPDLNAGNDSATDENVILLAADVGITKTNGVDEVNAGTPVLYTIVATNEDLDDTTRCTVSDTFPTLPPAALEDISWDCTPAGDASCEGVTQGTGNINQTVELPAGQSVIFTATATLSASATGTLINTATIGGCSLVDLNPANNSATDSDDIPPSADVIITKTNEADEVVAGTTVVYTIEARNLDPVDTISCMVSDTFPELLMSPGEEQLTWECVSTGGASCDGMTPGADLFEQIGDISQPVDLPAGASVTFTVTATLDEDATGTLTNTAIVSGCTLWDPDLGNNVSTDSDPILPSADVIIIKTNDQTEVIQGDLVTYAIVAANLDPDDTTTCTVSDNFPPALPPEDVSWGCTPSGLASCDSGTPGAGIVGRNGHIDQTIDLPAGDSVTFTVTGTVDEDAVGTLINTATIGDCSLPDLNAGNNSDTDSDPILQSADIGITKTNGVDEVVAGAPVVYTIVATNHDSADTTSCTVTDPFPAPLGDLSWDCISAGGASCVSGIPGSDLIGQTGDLSPIDVDLPAGATLTFTVTATLDADAAGTLENTATVRDCSLPDLNPANDSATDSDPILPSVDVGITKTNNETAVIQGDVVTYSIVATNHDLVDPTSCTVLDDFPPELLALSWGCEPTPGGATSCVSGTAGQSLSEQSGDINQAVDLLPGELVTFTVTATIDPDATGRLTNMATIVDCSAADLNDGNDAATDDDPILPAADVSVIKDNGKEEVIQGEEVTYTIVVTNVDLVDPTSCTVSDTFPVELLSVSWGCEPTAGGATSCITGLPGQSLSEQTIDIDHIVDLSASGSVTFTVTGTVDPRASGTLKNTAMVSGCSPADLNDGNDSATDEDPILPAADIDVTKGNGVDEVNAGAQVVYTIVATNLDMDDTTSCTVTDVFPGPPAALEGISWDCTPTGDASCVSGAPGTGLTDQDGDINQAVDLPPSESVTFTVEAMLSQDASGTLINTATVIECTLPDPDESNNSARDEDNVPPSADVGITKTSGQPAVVQGGEVTYEIVATNLDTVYTVSCTVSDDFPAELSNVSWDCAPTAGGGTTSCTGLPGQSASGTGNIGQTVDLPASASVTFTVTATLGQNATAPFTNTATVSDCTLADPNPDNNSGVALINFLPSADVGITKDNGETEVIQGDEVTYTIEARNLDPDDMVSCTVSDTFPAELPLEGLSWDCTPTGGASCDSGTPGADLTEQSGNISQLVDLPADGTVTFAVTATIDPDATGTLTNTATIGSCSLPDPNGVNNSATDTDPFPSADIDITKGNGVDEVSAGTPVAYTIVARNSGTVDATGCTVSDTFPPELPLDDLSWDCAPAGGASCESGMPDQSLGGQTGHISQAVDLPAGASVTFAVTATIADGATGMLTNTATVSGCSPIDDSATDSDPIVPCTDSDLDGSCNELDKCPGFNDQADSDMDGIPDGCDVCPGPLVLPDQDVISTVVWESCDRIEVGEEEGGGVHIPVPGDVTLRAPGSIDPDANAVVIYNGFSIKLGATFRVIVAPPLPATAVPVTAAEQRTRRQGPVEP